MGLKWHKEISPKGIFIQIFLCPKAQLVLWNKSYLCILNRTVFEDKLKILSNSHVTQIIVIIVSMCGYCLKSFIHSLIESSNTPTRELLLPPPFNRRGNGLRVVKWLAQDIYLVISRAGIHNKMIVYPTSQVVSIMPTRASRSTRLNSLHVFLISPSPKVRKRLLQSSSSTAVHPGTWRQPARAILRFTDSKRRHELCKCVVRGHGKSRSQRWGRVLRCYF